MRHRRLMWTGCHLGRDEGNLFTAVVKNVTLLWEIPQELFDVQMAVLKGLSLRDCLQSYSWSKISKQKYAKQTLVQVGDTEVWILKCHFSAYSSVVLQVNRMGEGERGELHVLWNLYSKITWSLLIISYLVLLSSKIYGSTYFCSFIKWQIS